MADPDDVHGTHCCRRHGCKYGDADCPVAAGVIEAEYRCELCPPVDWTFTPRTPSAAPGRAGVIRDGVLVALAATPELAERIARAMERFEWHEAQDRFLYGSEEDAS